VSYPFSNYALTPITFPEIEVLSIECNFLYDIECVCVCVSFHFNEEHVSAKER
jgi:hypothetical protein